jgi:hypothetical protein
MQALKTKGYEPYQAEQFVRQTDDSRNGSAWFRKKASDDYPTR